MSTTTETLKLIISGDGKLLRAEIGQSNQQIDGFTRKTTNAFERMSKKIAGGMKKMLLNPLTAAISAGSVLYAGKQLIEYKDALSTVGLNADLTGDQIVALDGTITDLAYKTGQNRDDLVVALSDIYDKTGDAKFAINSLFGAGISSTAMSAELSDTSRVVSSLRKGLNATAEEVTEYLDIMARMGNIGNFKFSEQASQAERLFSAGAMAVKIGRKNFAEYNAFVQSVKPIFASPDEAGTAIQQIMTTLKKRGREIEGLVGFKLFDSKGAIIDFAKTIKALSKLSVENQSKLFGEQVKAFFPLDSKDGIAEFDKFIREGQRAGFISEGMAIKTKEAKFQINALTTAAQEFAGTALTPIIADLTKSLTELTANPEAMAEFRKQLTEIAEALGQIGRLAQLVLPVAGTVFGAVNEVASTPKDFVTARDFSKTAFKDWKNIPKNERARLENKFNIGPYGADMSNRNLKIAQAVLDYKAQNNIEVNVRIDKDGQASTSVNSLNTNVKAGVNRGNHTAVQ